MKGAQSGMALDKDLEHDTLGRSRVRNGRVMMAGSIGAIKLRQTWELPGGRWSTSSRPQNYIPLVARKIMSEVSTTRSTSAWPTHVCPALTWNRTVKEGEKDHGFS